MEGEEEMDPEMAHMTVNPKEMALEAEEDVVKAHVVGTEMLRPDKLKSERMLA